MWQIIGPFGVCVLRGEGEEEGTHTHTHTKVCIRGVKKCVLERVQDSVRDEG